MALLCRLRALLIQKDTKLIVNIINIVTGLRALLIQKDTKHFRVLAVLE